MSQWSLKFSRQLKKLVTLWRNFNSSSRLPNMKTQSCCDTCHLQPQVLRHPQVCYEEVGHRQESHHDIGHRQGPHQDLRHQEPHQPEEVVALSSGKPETGPHSRTSPRIVDTICRSLQQAAREFRFGSSRAWWVCLVVSTLLTVVTRLHCISVPYAVIWDETHFGKMLSLYINRTYFFDVHPPGGKLMLTMFALVSGYDGTFAFEKPGDSYEGHPQLVYIRLLCATQGAALAPLLFLSAWTMTRRLPAALLAALLVTAETGTLTLTKFILLDPPLLFFMMASLLCLCRLQSSMQLDNVCRRPRWGLLSAAGVCLGCVVSVKFVGLLTVALAGLLTAAQLWHLLQRASLSELTQQVVARLATLVLLPGLVYLAFFIIHDALLTHSHSPHHFQEATHSPGFQMRLVGNDLYNLSQPADIGYGNLVTLRNTAISGGYLRSYNVTYPSDVMPSRGQQVIVAGLKDSNSWIQILFPGDSPDEEDGSYSGAVETLANGDVVRLLHNATRALIGCGDRGSPVSTKHTIVFAKPVNLSGLETWGLDPGFQWTVSLVADDEQQQGRDSALASAQSTEEGLPPASPIKALASRMQLQCSSKRGSCYLNWSQLKLPHKWGLGGEEVSCSYDRNDPLTHWIFERNYNPKMSNVTFDGLQSGLLSRLVESHQVMKFRNSRMKELEPGRHSQRPWMWPVGYSVHAWYDNGVRVSLLANPLVLALNFGCLLSGGLLVLARAYVAKRTGRRHLQCEADKLAYWCKWLLVGYLLHYLPFFGMTRVLYYHHYFPALQFSSLLTAVQLGTAVCHLRSPAATAAASATLVAALTCTFMLYCYVGYGTPTAGPFNPTNSTFKHLRLYEHWEI